MTAVGNVLQNVGKADGKVEVTSFQVAGDATVYDAGDIAEITGKGTVEIDEDGAYVFTPKAGFGGDVPVITYTLKDESDTTETSTLTITVDAPTDTFRDRSESVSTPQGTAVSGNVIGSDITVAAESNAEIDSLAFGIAIGVAVERQRLGDRRQRHRRTELQRHRQQRRGDDRRHGRGTARRAFRPAVRSA